MAKTKTQMKKNLKSKPGNQFRRFTVNLNDELEEMINSMKKNEFESMSDVVRRSIIFTFNSENVAEEQE